MTIFEGKKLNIFLNIRLVSDLMIFVILNLKSFSTFSGDLSRKPLSNRMESNSKLVKIRLVSVRKKRQKLGFSEFDTNRIRAVFKNISELIKPFKILSLLKIADSLNYY